MADSKITALTAISTVDPTADPLVIVDVSDTSMAASGTTKKSTINQLLGSGGTATLASATITGALGAAGLNVTGATIPSNGVYLSAANNLAFSTGGSNRVTIDSGGTIGVGITAPFADTGYKAIDLRGTTGGEVVLGSTADRQVTITGDGTNGMTLNTVNATPLRFFTQGGERARFNATGAFIFNGGNTSANGIGIAFPDTQSASSDANCLDDYEEGTWTIGLTFGGASTGITANASVGRYTKIGRQVTVSGLLSLTSKGSSTGIAEITGLPFTIANANEAYSVANVRFNGVSFADVPISIGANNSTKILLQEITNAGAVTDITDADFTNTSSCMISFTYTV